MQAGMTRLPMLLRHLVNHHPTWIAEDSSRWSPKTTCCPNLDSHALLQIRACSLQLVVFRRCIVDSNMYCDGEHRMIFYFITGKVISSDHLNITTLCGQNRRHGRRPRISQFTLKCSLAKNRDPYTLGFFTAFILYICHQYICGEKLSCGDSDLYTCKRKWRK